MSEVVIVVRLPCRMNRAASWGVLKFKFRASAFNVLTSTTWCILCSTSLASAEATWSERLVMFKDSATSFRAIRPWSRLQT